LERGIKSKNQGRIRFKDKNMKTKEFNLSEKQYIVITAIINAISTKKYNQIGGLLNMILENDKEFIKRLKEEFCECEEFPKSDRICVYCNKIDKLAGDKLK